MTRLADLVPNTRCGNLSVEIENRPRLLSPRLERVMIEIASLTRHGGPGFLILSQGTRDYMQVAGDGNAYVVECRQYRDEMFRHYAAGHPSPEIGGWLKVLTNGFHIKARANESLTCNDVQYIAYVYIRGRCRSRFFAWRDMTGDFS